MTSQSTPELLFSSHLFVLDRVATLAQAAINVEGSDGWADRLRHLTLSGSVVLKQDAGVVEWFEPLLRPFEHALPVSSSLHNLTASIAWVRAHQEEARAIANRSADLMEELLSSDGLLEYATSLWRGYATLATKYEHPRDHDFSSRIHLAANFVRFTCDTPLVHKAWVTTCRFIG